MRCILRAGCITCSACVKQRLIHVSFILQLVKKLMDSANQPRTALMLPAIVYAHLVLLDMANVRGE